MSVLRLGLSFWGYSLRMPYPNDHNDNSNNVEETGMILFYHSRLNIIILKDVYGKEDMRAAPLCVCMKYIAQRKTPRIARVQ